MLSFNNLGKKIEHVTRKANSILRVKIRLPTDVSKTAFGSWRHWMGSTKFWKSDPLVDAVRMSSNQTTDISLKLAALLTI